MFFVLINTDLLESPWCPCWTPCWSNNNEPTVGWPASTTCTHRRGIGWSRRTATPSYRFVILIRSRRRPFLLFFGVSVSVSSSSTSSSTPTITLKMHADIKARRTPDEQQPDYRNRLAQYQQFVSSGVQRVTASVNRIFEPIIDVSKQALKCDGYHC